MSSTYRQQTARAGELSPRSIHFKKGRKVVGTGTGDKEQSCVDEINESCVSWGKANIRDETRYAIMRYRTPGGDQFCDFLKSSNHAPTNAIISW